MTISPRRSIQGSELKPRSYSSHVIVNMWRAATVSSQFGTNGVDGDYLMTISKVFFTLLFFLLLLQAYFQHLSLSGLGSVDELATAALFIVGVSWQFVKTRTVSRLMIAIIALYVYSAFTSFAFGLNRNGLDIAIQSFINIKFFVLAGGLYAIVLLTRYPYSRLMAGMVGITSCGLLLNAVLGSAFFTILHVEPYQSSSALNLTRFSGLQLNPNAVGVAMAFGVICLFVRIRARGSGSPALYAAVVALSIGIVATASRSAMVFELIGLAFTAQLRKTLLQTLFLVCILSIIGLVQSDIFLALYTKSLSNLTAIISGPEENYPRWLMTYYGLHLAASHFPIGTGAGTFGSVLSVDSPIYAQLGLLRFHSISSMAGVFDSNFGSVAGEYGFAGILFYYGLFVYALCRIGSAACGPLPLDRRVLWMFIILGCFATFLRPFFSSSYYGALFLIAFVVCVTQARSHGDAKTTCSVHAPIEPSFYRTEKLRAQLHLGYLRYPYH